MLKLMKTEFKGEVAGLPADSSNVPQTLIDFLIEEAGEDPYDAIASSTKLPTNSASSMKKAMQVTTRTEIQTLILSIRGTSTAKPVRLKEHYPEPHRGTLQEGLLPPPPPRRKGTRRECNP
jgi:hypothetical protein